MTSQKDKLNIFREVLTRYNPGDFLNEKDYSTVMDLFKGHPSWNIKEGVGIEKISVNRNKYWQKVFDLHRKDKTQTDISFVIAAKGKSFTDRQRIKSACRNAIIPQIMNKKNTIRWGIDKCPITDNILVLHETHIDHYDLSFDELVEKWILNFNINELISKLNDHAEDNAIEDIFTDDLIRNDFIKFHNENTHLRAVTKNANLSLLRRSNGTKTNQ